MAEHVDFELGGVGSLKPSEVLNGIIAAVPTEWLDLTGRLEIPELHVKNGRVLVDTGYSFGPRCDGKDLLYTRDRRRGEDAEPPFDVIGVAEGRLPLFIRFVEAGSAGGYNREAFIRAKGVAMTWIDRGYRGPMEFSRDAFGPAREWSARCGVYCYPREFKSSRPLLSWCLRLQWEARRGGSFEHVRKLAELARTLGLRERKQRNMQIPAA